MLLVGVLGALLPGGNHVGGNPNLLGELLAREALFGTELANNLRETHGNLLVPTLACGNA